MNLSPHFTLEELTQSDTAVRIGVDNSCPPPGVLLNLERLAGLLEEVRALLKVPMHINSGWRCPDLNRALGSKDTSAHVLGLAADFTAPQFGTPLEIAKAIAASGIQFDQLIQEGTWVHIGLRKGSLRGEQLTAHFSDGRASYTAGLTESQINYA